MKITQDDLLDAIRQALEKPEGGEGTTVAQMSEQTGVSEERLRKGIRLLQAQGRVEVTWVRQKAIDGRTFSIPAYRIRP